MEERTPIQRISLAIKKGIISASALGREADVAASTILRAVHGETDPGISTVYEIELALDRILAKDFQKREQMMRFEKEETTGGKK